MRLVYVVHKKRCGEIFWFWSFLQLPFLGWLKKNIPFFPKSCFCAFWHLLVEGSSHVPFMKEYSSTRRDPRCIKESNMLVQQIIYEVSWKNGKQDLANKKNTPKLSSQTLSFSMIVESARHPLKSRIHYRVIYIYTQINHVCTGYPANSTNRVNVR